MKIPQVKNVGSTIVSLNNEPVEAIHRIVMELIPANQNPEMKKFVAAVRKHAPNTENILQLDIFEMNQTDWRTKTKLFPLLNSKAIDWSVENMPIYKGLYNILKEIKNSKHIEVTDEYLHSKECQKAFRDFADNEVYPIDLNEQIPLEDCHEEEVVIYHAGILFNRIGELYKGFIESFN